MIKIKPIIICASTAFVLSFLTALIARTGLPISLLKAVIFAVVFGGIAVGIQIVYDKFLSEGDTNATEVASQQKTVGGKVDLVVSEEELPGDKEMPAFTLDSTRHVLTAADVGFTTQGMRKANPSAASTPVDNAEKSEPEKKVEPEEKAEAVPSGAGVQPEPAQAVSETPPATPAKDGFVPTDLAASQKDSAKEEAAPASAPSPAASPAEPATETAGEKKEEVASPQSQRAPGPMDDELPELDDFPGLNAGGDDIAKGSDDENIIEDSDFAEEGSTSSSRQTEFPDGKIADSKDAELMAKAIQTVLKKEE